MGSWGTALYSNDTSSDVRDMCNEIYPFVSVEEGTRLILKEYAEIVNSDAMDNDCADFWFALADWQWKHGILSDEIRAKAISLLEAHTGIEEWEESGSASDVKKRLEVMDKLLCQLKLPQPPVKIPKSKAAKAKHKPGDIIVFRTCSKDYEYAETVWNIEECGFTDHYTDEVASKLSKKLSPPYEAYEKYMAVLCVGTIQEPYSHYLPDITETRSIYAYYDYISDKEPTLDDLKQCGFLPLNIRYGADGDSLGKNAWTYTFALFAQSFTKKEGGSEQIISKICCLDENERFYTLLSQKHYDKEYILLPELFGAFSDIYDEKIRLELIGVELDNLLNADKSNPALRTPENPPDWYWGSGLHDACIVGVETYEFPFDYNKYAGQKNQYDRNMLLLKLDAKGAMFDFRIKEIRFFNYKILPESMELTERKKIWWLADKLIEANGRYELDILLEDVDSYPEQFHFKLRFDRAETYRT